MKKRIGLVDPALRREGHSVRYISYIYELVKYAGFSVGVADFDNLLRQETDIEEQDLINLGEELPTEAFPRKRKSMLNRIIEEYNKYRFFRSMKPYVDDEVSLWIITTYDPYALPLLYYSGLKRKKIVPIIHYSRYFRKNALKFYGINSFWEPRLLFKTLSSCELAFCLLHEHRDELYKMGYNGRCVYLPYNSQSQQRIDRDNRSKVSRKFRVCTVCIIRDDKDINLVIRAVKNMPDIEYFIGGKIADYWEKSAYVAETRKLISENDNVIGKFNYLSDSDYNSEIEKSHFTVIPISDKYAKSVQQTGLLIDSLVNKRPVIGPNIFPINKYVNDYGVGLLYEKGSLSSLQSALSLAQEKGVDAYYNNICSFLKKYSFEENSKKMFTLLEEVLC